MKWFEPNVLLTEQITLGTIDDDAIGSPTFERNSQMIERRRMLHLTSLVALAGGFSSFSLWPSRANAQAVRPMVWGGTVPLKLDPHDVVDVPSLFFKNNCYDALYEYLKSAQFWPRLVPAELTSVNQPAASCL